MIADPGHQPDDEINRGDETEKKEQPRKREPHIEEGEEARNHIKNKYGQGDTVERREASEENKNAAWGELGHGLGVELAIRKARNSNDNPKRERNATNAGWLIGVRGP